MNTTPSATAAPGFTRFRGRRVAAAAALALTLVAAGGGALAVAAPSAPSPGAALLHQVEQRLGVDTSSMPQGYTSDQYDAFWGAGYTADDVHALQDLWHTDTTETKARAGQMLLDHEEVPVAPSDPELSALHAQERALDDQEKASPRPSASH